MIWFPTFEQNFTQNCYFDVRDVDIRYRYKTFNGMVTGVLGIDSDEFYTEITIGPEYDIQIFPVWNDDGQIENIPDTVNQEELKVALAAEVKKLLPGMRASTYQVLPHFSDDTFDFLAEEGDQQAA